jgi:hypothetical protein
VKLTPHLSLEELHCKNGTEYPARWIADRAVPLAAVFEEIRALWGLPIRVLSAYRTTVYNAKVGGAPNSQHVQGRALDLAPPTGVTLADFAAGIRALAKQKPGLIGGLGFYPTFVHVDIRPSKVDRVATWHGGRPVAEIPPRT